MEFVDTHCHIHSADFPLDASDVISEARTEGVTKLICVGTDLADSILATQFVAEQSNCWASVGIHPHEAKRFVKKVSDLDELKKLLKSPKVVAIGECGLDYYYDHSPRTDQIELFEFQLNLAQEHNLPLIFHVRSAFDDFWPIIDNFKNLRGVIHSFTAGVKVLDQALKRDLFIGLNGIMTFTKDDTQLAAAKALPSENLLLETDSPFLTPEPFRGKICQPKYVRATAEFIANLRSEELTKLATASTTNAKALFNI